MSRSMPRDGGSAQWRCLGRGLGRCPGPGPGGVQAQAQGGVQVQARGGGVFQHALRQTPPLLCSVQTFVHNSFLLTGQKFNCMVRDSLCPWQWLLIDFNVIPNCVQKFVLLFAVMWRSLLYYFSLIKRHNGHCNIPDVVVIW